MTWMTLSMNSRYVATQLSETKKKVEEENKSENGEMLLKRRKIINANHATL